MLKELCQKALYKSLWVYHTNTGACNGCDIEVIDVMTPYYDAERFGLKLVGSPRHADVLVCCGPVTRQIVPALFHGPSAKIHQFLTSSVRDACDRRGLS